MCGRPLYKSTAKVCSVSCALDYNLKYPEKIKTYMQTLEKKEWQKKKKEIQEKLKTLGEYEKEAKTVFQRWIRMRDKDLPCISCGTISSPVWDAGHWWEAGQYSGLIFDPDNCHKQCRKCNFYLNGNPANYRLGLIQRYGERFVVDLEDRKDRLRSYEYTRDELINIKKTYQEKLKAA